MAAERTLVLVKPDAMRRQLAGEIVGRLERRGLELRAARLLTVDRPLAEQHYAEHTEKPFFGELIEFITSGPTLAPRAPRARPTGAPPPREPPLRRAHRKAFLRRADRVHPLRADPRPRRRGRRRD